MAEVIFSALGDELSVLSGASCAFGVFDGVHRGHRFIIDQACAAATAQGAPSVIITFDTDPDETFARKGLRKIMTNEQRILALSALPVDAIIALPFTHEFAALEPEAFLDTVFGMHVPHEVHVGADFRFGAHATGTVDTISAWGRTRGCSAFGHDLLAVEGAPITASRIRSVLALGDVEQAKALLGHPYTLRGTVEHGRGEGGGFGFKTANLNIPDALRVLADGVYAAHAFIRGNCYKAAVSVGVAPSFPAADCANCEVHILDFSENLYGETLQVSFAARLRPLRRFDSLDELIATVNANIAWVRENLS